MTTPFDVSVTNSATCLDSPSDPMSQSKADVLDFAKAWSDGSTRRKREIQKAIFPNGLPFSVRKRKTVDFEPPND